MINHAFRVSLFFLLSIPAKLVQLIYNQPIVIVIYYHSVDEYEWKHSVSKANFIAQMKWLKKYAKIIDLEDVYLHSCGEKRLSGLNVAISFDDGYKDFIINVFPVIKRFNFPVSLFFSTNTDTSHSNEFRKERMSVEDIKNISRDGLVKIYSHAHNHVDLTKLTEAELDDDLQKSLIIIDGINKNNIQLFCYPYGYRNKLLVDVLKNKGFDAAFGISQGTIKFNNKSDLYKLKRVQIERSTSMIEFILKMCLAVDWYEKLRLLYRKYVKD